MLQCQLESWVNWPATRCAEPRNGVFKVDYTRLLEDLNYELEKLDATEIVLRLSLAGAVKGSARAYDGWPKANVKWMLPGVILNFESAYGPLQYSCDTYNHWQDNLRGIGLTLERLRDVERYGAVKGGVQYKGFAALPPPPSSGKGKYPLTPESASLIMASFLGPGSKDRLFSDALTFQSEYWKLAMRMHPDKGGNAQEFRTMQEAAEVLKKHHGLS